MKFIWRSSLCLLLLSAVTLNANGQSEAVNLRAQPLVFTPMTLKAFDRSGKAVIHVARMRADGVIETYCTTNEPVASAWLAGAKAGNPPSHAVMDVEE